MKTISLAESAYQRLNSWKDGCTFSEVVERMVPAKSRDKEREGCSNR